MTDLATALAPNDELSPFDDRLVLRTAIKVVGAGDGLSQAMKVDPVELHIGDRVFMVMEGEVTKIAFEEVKDTNALARVHVIKAGTATMVSESLVSDALDQQREMIAAADRQASGAANMDDALAKEAEHEDGYHNGGLVDGCPMCTAELEQEQLEADQPD